MWDNLIGGSGKLFNQLYTSDLAPMHAVGAMGVLRNGWIALHQIRERKIMTEKFQKFQANTFQVATKTMCRQFLIKSNVVIHKHPKD